MAMNDGPPVRNVVGINEAQSIWRVFPLNRALEFFERSENVLVAPSKWEDPFENFLSHVPLVTGNGEHGSFGEQVTGGFVGQCWTHEAKETDATWRIYAPDKVRGVRIQVQASSLFDTIYDQSNQASGTTCFLAAIKYLPESEIHPWLQRLADLGPLGLFSTGADGIASTLLVKRNEFAHENEVRLLFNTNKAPASIKSFPCDPNKLVLHVLLDPRWGSNEAATVTKQLRCFGYTGPIEHSELYQIPKFTPIRI